MAIFATPWHVRRDAVGRLFGRLTAVLRCATGATKYLCLLGLCTGMIPLLQFGALSSPPVLLAGLLLVALTLLIGRFVMKVAWRLVIIAIIAVTVLWVLGALGFNVI